MLDEWVTRLVFDYVGRLAAFASADIEASAEALAREDLRRRGLTVRDRQPLLAGQVQGPRRTSVVKWGDGLSLRVKRLDAEEGGCWLQLRLFMDTAAAGYVHALMTETGMLVCVVTGRTDQDAWLRIQGELSRQGFEIASGPRAVVAPLKHRLAGAATVNAMTVLQAPAIETTRAVAAPLLPARGSCEPGQVSRRPFLLVSNLRGIAQLSPLSNV